MTESSAEISSLNEASASVQTHLGIIQGVIERMATNSTSCKAWCITLVSAILVVIADKGKPNYAFIAFLPTLFFAALDAYYLAMEKGFRNSYNDFVKKVHNGTITACDLFSVCPHGETSMLRIESLKSFSIWGFYFGLGVMVLLARFIVL